MPKGGGQRKNMSAAQMLTAGCGAAKVLKILLLKKWNKPAANPALRLLSESASRLTGKEACVLAKKKLCYAQWAKLITMMSTWHKWEKKETAQQY